MSDSPNFDKGLAHRYFSADCFNRVWTLIEKPGRSPADDEQMLLLTMASLWHWTQRDDCADRHLSIGYWQVSRVYALCGDGRNALQYAEICLRYSQNEPPFFLAYAHEAIARAAVLNRETDRVNNHITEARRLATQVANLEERTVLEKDLDTIHPPARSGR